jgi:hypothetical protein
MYTFTGNDDNKLWVAFKCILTVFLSFYILVVITIMIIYQSWNDISILCYNLFLILILIVFQHNLYYIKYKSIGNVINDRVIISYRYQNLNSFNPFRDFFSDVFLLRFFLFIYGNIVLYYILYSQNVEYNSNSEDNLGYTLTIINIIIYFFLFIFDIIGKVVFQCIVNERLGELNYLNYQNTMNYNTYPDAMI